MVRRELKEMSKGLPILLDDEAAHRLIAVRALKKIGITVREASSLAQARKMIAEEPPQFMIIDRNLDGESGLSIIREARANSDTKNIPLVMLSTSEELSDIYAAYQSGVNFYLYKEVEKERFTANLIAAVSYLTR